MILKIIGINTAIKDFKTVVFNKSLINIKPAIKFKIEPKGSTIKVLNIIAKMEKMITYKIFCFLVVGISKIVVN